MLLERFQRPLKLLADRGRGGAMARRNTCTMELRKNLPSAAAARLAAARPDLRPGMLFGGLLDCSAVSN